MGGKEKKKCVEVGSFQSDRRGCPSDFRPPSPPASSKGTPFYLTRLPPHPRLYLTHLPPHPPFFLPSKVIVWDVALLCTARAGALHGAGTGLAVVARQISDFPITRMLFSPFEKLVRFD